MIPLKPKLRQGSNAAIDDVPPANGHKTGARVGVLITLIAMQAITVVFFLGDLIGELMVLGFDAHTTSEAIATLVLFFGIIIGAKEMSRIVRAGKRAESALKMASGAFSELLEDKFRLWSLTPSEAEVAMLTLKGFDAAQIANLRNTAPGTVRAQLASIYGKSDSNGRGQFVSLFIDALLDDPASAKSATK